MGEPGPDRIKKATRIAKVVKIYSFNSKSDVWWAQNEAKLTDLNAYIYQVAWHQLQPLVKLVQRTMDMTLTLSEQTAYFTTATGDCEITYTTLQKPKRVDN